MNNANVKNMFEELDSLMGAPKVVAKPQAQPSPGPRGQENITVVPTETPVSPVAAPVVSAPVDINEAMKKIKSIESELNSSYYEREEAIKVMLVALISKMSTFFIGPPGTGKTDMTSELCGRIVGGKYFSFLFNKTTDPSEVFGPFSLTAMERDQFKRKTEAYLPEAHIAYMDEINTMVSFI